MMIWIEIYLNPPSSLNISNHIKRIFIKYHQSYPRFDIETEQSNDMITIITKNIITLTQLLFLIILQKLEHLLNLSLIDLGKWLILLEKFLNLSASLVQIIVPRLALRCLLDFLSFIRVPLCGDPWSHLRLTPLWNRILPILLRFIDVFYKTLNGSQLLILGGYIMNLKLFAFEIGQLFRMFIGFRSFGPDLLSVPGSLSVITLLVNLTLFL